MAGSSFLEVPFSGCQLEIKAASQKFKLPEWAARTLECKFLAGSLKTRLLGSLGYAETPTSTDPEHGNLGCASSFAIPPSSGSLVEGSREDRREAQGWASSPASMTTEEEPHAESQPDDDDEQVTLAPPPGEDRTEEVELQEDTAAKKRRSRKDSDSDDSAKAFEGVQLWEAHDEPLPEVLPSEVLGWLLLRRAGLTSQQRLSVQAAAGNSLKLDSVERALRAMEEDLQHEGQGKGGREPPRRRTYWVEESGHWSLLLGESSELDDLVEGGDTLYVGERLPPQVILWHSSDSWTDPDAPSTSWWSSLDSQEGWSEDVWWNEEPDLSDLTPEEQKEVDEAFAVAEQKMRSFVLVKR